MAFGLVAGLTTVFSFCCALILGFLDKRNDKYLALREKLIKERNETTSDTEDKKAVGKYMINSALHFKDS